MAAKRPRKACVRCQNKKIKCSGCAVGAEACTACQKAGIDCQPQSDETPPPREAVTDTSSPILVQSATASTTNGGGRVGRSRPTRGRTSRKQLKEKVVEDTPEYYAPSPCASTPFDDARDSPFSSTSFVAPGFSSESYLYYPYYSAQSQDSSALHVELDDDKDVVKVEPGVSLKRELAYAREWHSPGTQSGLTFRRINYPTSDLRTSCGEDEAAPDDRIIPKIESVY